MKKLLIIIVLILSFNSVFSQEYSIKEMSLKGEGREMQIKYKGTVSIDFEKKYLIMETPASKMEGYFNLDEEGNIVYQVENREHTLKIIDENKGSYDTKMIIHTIDYLGGMTTILYCKKE